MGYNARAVEFQGESMTGLLLVAHGSRCEASNQEVRQLTNRLRNRLIDKLPLVDCAFLELAEPTIQDGIDLLVGSGERTIVVVPYFLSAGRHVSRDIPEIMDIKRQQHPDIDIIMAPHLGAAEGVAELITSLVP